MNATLESLEKQFPGEGMKRFQEIASEGGFGNIPPEYVGGLDLFSVLDPTNTVVSEKTKDKIAKLAGVSRKDADEMVTSGKVIAGDQFVNETPKFPKAAK